MCAKQDLYDIITEFRLKNPRASIPETAFPEPDLLTETENMIIDDILALLNKHGLTSHQSQNLLERLGSIIEIGQRLAKNIFANGNAAGNRRRLVGVGMNGHHRCVGQQSRTLRWVQWNQRSRS